MYGMLDLARGAERPKTTKKSAVALFLNSPDLTSPPLTEALSVVPEGECPKAPCTHKVYT